MFRQLYNTFKTEKTNILSGGMMNHCATVCPHKNGVLIAWYTGTRECAEDQHVCLTYWCGKTKTVERLGDKTGNPVLWNSGKNTYLLYSRFEKMDLPSIDRWKHCSLWVRIVGYNGKEITIGTPMKIAKSNQHLLGRCTPIDYIVPLYNEVEAHGIIMDLNSSETMSKIGDKMIQPCIWHNNIYHSLSRNFRTFEKYAKYSNSIDCKTWSEPVKTEILNNNSSLCTVNWSQKQLLLWNDTSSIQRTSLTLGVVTIKDNLPHIENKIVIAKHGSYPTMCVDKYNRLHMVYTNEKRQIKHVMWNMKKYGSMMF